jgi:hypothetical protein
MDRPHASFRTAPLSAKRPVVDGIEHRRAERIPQDGKATILVCQETGHVGPPRTVRLRDVSLRGVSFVSTTPLARGQQFVYHLPRGANAAPTPVLCTVAYCRPEVDAGYRVGAEFTCVLQQEAPSRFEPVGDGADIERIRRSILS